MEIILWIINIFLIAVSVLLALQNKALQDSQKVDRGMLEYYRRRYASLMYDYEYLQRAQRFSMPRAGTPIEIPKGTIDAVKLAVKLAMKVSHPDNGGNNEDFIKYREVYQRLTGKRG